MNSLLLPLDAVIPMTSEKFKILAARFTLPLILLLVALSFSSILSNSFVSWDDEVYIVNNSLIQTLSWDNFKHLFNSSFEGHYHPFTLISLSIDYFIFGLNPTAFHLHNLILHLINVFLVYFIIKKITASEPIAIITATLFGLHPMHVEAVVWATARKDVLYSFYFLLSILFYFLHKEKNKRYWYILSLIAFVFSLFSKGQAVFLPICLVLFSYLRGKSLFSKANLKDKVPYFILALLFGVIAIISQEKTGYTGETTSLGIWWKTVLMACLSFWMYIYKLLVPFSLSAYYPIPGLDTFKNISLGIGSLILSVGLIYGLTNWYKSWRPGFSGIVFFIVNVIIFLRWIPVSNYIIADRYSYISSIGLFFIAAIALLRLKDYFSIPYSWTIVIILLFSVLGTATYSRTKTWKDTASLVKDILTQYPDVYPALNSRGNESLRTGDTSAAMQDFNHAIQVQPRQSRAWANRGSLYFRQGKLQQALDDFNQAVSMDYINARLLNNRGLILDALGRKEEAMVDFNNAIKYDPSLIQAYASRAKIKNQSADFKGAIEDIETALNQGFSNAPIFFELGFAWYNLKDFYKAKLNFDKAIRLKPDYFNALAYRGYTQYNDGDFISALADLNKAISMDTTNPIAYGMRGMALIRLHRNEEACKDFIKAEAMGLIQVKKEREKYCGN